MVIVLQFLVLTHPPRDLSEQLAWRPLAASTAVVLRWVLLLAVLLIIGRFANALDA